MVEHMNSSVLAVFGVLFGVAGDALEMVEQRSFEGLSAIAVHFTALSAFSFLLFNLLCTPCFAAIGAIRREMNSAKWTWFAIGYLCVFAYVISLIVYQLGLLVTGAGFTIVTAIAMALAALLLFQMFRPYTEAQRLTIAAVKA
jgi:ferrous iron transport protein B